MSFKPFMLQEGKLIIMKTEMMKQSNRRVFDSLLLFR